MTETCAKCGVPLPKVEQGPPRRVCEKCRTATLMGVSASQLLEQLVPRKTNEAAPAGKAGVPQPSPPSASSAPAEDDDPERSSVLSDLRAITAQATAVEPPVAEPLENPDTFPEAPDVTDEDIEVVPPPPPPPIPVASASPVAPVAPAPASAGPSSPAAPPAIAAPSPPAPSAAQHQCPRCGYALQSSAEAPSPTAPTWLPKGAQAILAHRGVRTFAPWAIASVAVVVAVVALARGRPAPSDHAEASASADAAEPPVDSAAPRPPRVSPPGLGPRPKPAPSKSAPSKSPPKPG